ncbi:MAG TPA: DUF1501 domain-containing protein [Planctomycetaceae bacterium]|nr:DUF1501 domain-containing protein [Planctomycetaceae bacterium]
MGFGGLVFGQLLAEATGMATSVRAAGRAPNPLDPRPAHFPVRAKRVIHLFMNGGPSHLDTFDPKPLLAKYAGKELPGGNLRTERPTGAALPSPFQFQKRGESGIEVSELFARTAESIDDIAVIRSMYADVPNHEPSLLLMNCGEARLIRPSLGSWLTYGLGTENQNLPAFIAMCPGGYPIQESQNWQAGFLPGIYQGTYIDTRHTEIDKLIAHIRNDRVSRGQQRQQLDLLRQLNERHKADRADDPQLDARLQSFELAYRMQRDAAEAFDVSREPKHILDMYGPGTQARQILIARRLIERGVRFVQVWHGEGQPWDSHDDLEVNHRRLAGQCDQAIGALLKDLRQRGLLDETLVIWGGEFGRTPAVELPKKGSNEGKINGRDHNHWGFTVWLAGGGVRGGYVHGATDEFGFRAVENRVHVHDLHATILRLMGFDHERFTYRYAGRDFRLTDVHGRVVEELIA